MAFKTVLWRLGSTWRKLGFINYGDSREFRKVLEANPNFDIGNHPAEGDLVFIDESSIANNTTGNLNTVNLTDFAGTDRAQGIEDDYPWTNYEDLYKRLGNYTSYSLENYEELNGQTI